MPTTKLVQGFALSAALFSTGAVANTNEEFDFPDVSSTEWQHEGQIRYVTEFICEDGFGDCNHTTPLSHFVIKGNGGELGYHASLKIDSTDKDGGSTSKKSIRLNTLNMSYNGENGSVLTAGLLSPYILGNKGNSLHQNMFPLTYLDDTLTEAVGVTGVSLEHSWLASDTTQMTLQANGGERIKDVNRYWDESRRFNDDRVEEGKFRSFGVELQHEALFAKYEIGAQRARTISETTEHEDKGLVYVNVQPNDGNWRLVSEYGRQEQCFAGNCEDERFYTAVVSYDIIEPENKNEIITVSAGFNNEAQAIEVSFIEKYINDCHIGVSTAVEFDKGQTNVGGHWALSCNY